MSVLVDSNIPMYASGRPHPFKSRCTAFLEAVARQDEEAESDVEVLQEILYRYSHTQEVAKGFVDFEAFARVIPRFHPIRLSDMLRAKEVFRAHPGIKPRDAIHAAIMLERGTTTIISFDQDFDRIPGIHRVEPS